jgi:hypothetical protein
MMNVSQATFDEIRQKLVDSGYDWTLNTRQDSLQMGEFILVREEGHGSPHSL